VNKLLKVLARIGSAEQLHLVYDAGPTGFGLQRALKAKGYVCEIIAPPGRVFAIAKPSNALQS
jgi:hypothetical protein